MSVYINGMEMPTVRDTLVLVKTNGTAIVYEDEAYVTTVIPVPPHGRLIDADELTVHDNYIIDDMPQDIIFAKEVDEALTIIEAEEVGNET